MIFVLSFFEFIFICFGGSFFNLFLRSFWGPFWDADRMFKLTPKSRKTRAKPKSVQGPSRGRFWNHFGDHFGVILGSFWDHFWVILESSWDHSGVILGSSWGYLGSPWAILGPFSAIFCLPGASQSHGTSLPGGFLG